MLQPLIQKFQRKITSEIERKNKVLASNKELFQLYKDLVVSGIVSAEEFWSSHSKELEDAASKSNEDESQRVGVQASFLATLKASSKPDEQSGGIRYNLTPDAIEAIFKTYPTVRQKHSEYVPHTMSETEFWSCFFQSHYFHGDRLESASDLFAGDQTTNVNNDSLSRFIESDRFVNVSGFVDSDSTMAAMARDVAEARSNALQDGALLARQQGRQQTNKLTPAHINRLIVQRMNFHSERVLSAQGESTHSGKSLADRIFLTDLLPKGKNGEIETKTHLDINNADGYLQAASVMDTDSIANRTFTPSEVSSCIDLFRTELQTYHPQPNLAFVDRSGAYDDIAWELTGRNGNVDPDGHAVSPQTLNFSTFCGGSYSSSLEAEYKGKSFDIEI